MICKFCFSLCCCCTVALLPLLHFIDAAAAVEICWHRSRSELASFAISHPASHNCRHRSGSGSGWGWDWGRSSFLRLARTVRAVFNYAQLGAGLVVAAGPDTLSTSAGTSISISTSCTWCSCPILMLHSVLLNMARMLGSFRSFDLDSDSS